MPRLSKLHRRAILLLFLEGAPPKSIARAFGLTRLDVEEVLRRAMR